MPIEGPLKELSIHDVFQLLDLSHKTGALRVSSELRQNTGTVYFDEGNVVGAEIRSNPHPLGEVLLRAGKLREEDLAQARSIQSGGDPRRLGDILVGMGAVTAKELNRQVRLQIEAVVFEMMSWSEGYFAFEEGNPADSGAEALIRIPTSVLLMEAARRIDEWANIEKKISHLGIVPALAPGDGSGMLDLLPEEWEVLAVIDGERDVRGVASALGRPEFDVAKTLFGLASAGIILLEDPVKRGDSGGPAEDLALLISEVEDHLATRDVPAALIASEAAVSAHPHQPLAHLVRGKALLAAGQFADASDSLWLSIELDPLSATSRRFLGYSLAAQGHFREAAEAWERWRRLGSLPPEEESQAALVERVRQAALTIDLALRGMCE